jgi:hypothetical protein
MILIGTVLSFISAVWAFVSWPLRRLGRAIGVTSAPYILLGNVTLVALEGDPRPGYDSWWHLECINRQRHKLASMIHTQDAVGCRVRLTFTPLFDDTAVMKDDGVFLVGTSQPPSEDATLVVDRPMPIPLYLRVPKDTPHPITGQPLKGGSYLTGAQFLFQPALVERQRLTGGTYKVTVKVTWDRRSFTWHQEIQAQTPLPTVTPSQVLSSSSSPRKRSEVISDGIRWRQTGPMSYSGEPDMEALCPEADFAIEIMVKVGPVGELKPISYAYLNRDYIIGRGYRLWCPGLNEHEEHEIEIEHPRRWAEVESVAERKLKAQIEIDRYQQK